MSHVDKFEVVSGGSGFVELHCSECHDDGDFRKCKILAWDGADAGGGEANLARIVSSAQAHWAQKHGGGEA